MTMSLPWQAQSQGPDEFLSIAANPPKTPNMVDLAGL
jgi:hypothetical protein